MICPICKSEYRDGFTRCADCEIDLVQTTPDKKQSAPERSLNINDSIEILQVMNYGDMAFIKSLLEAENIMYSFLGESMLGKTWGAAKARLCIHESDVEKAVVLLKDAGML